MTTKAFTIEPALHDQPKVIELTDIRGGHAALGLYTLAGSWCAWHESADGVVPVGQIKRLGSNTRYADMLVECGLWVKVDAGYQFKSAHVAAADPEVLADASN